MSTNDDDDAPVHETARDLLAHQLTLGEAIEVLNQVLRDMKRALVPRAALFELLDALDALGMEEFPTDSKRMARIKRAYAELKRVRDDTDDAGG